MGGADGQHVVDRQRAFAIDLDIGHRRELLFAIVAHANVLAHARQRRLAANAAAEIAARLRQDDVVAAQTKRPRGF